VAEPNRVGSSPFSARSCRQTFTSTSHQSHVSIVKKIVIVKHDKLLEQFV
jgi:hypothetical protein